MTDHITNTRALLEQALEALSVSTTPLARDRQTVLGAIRAIRAELAKPAQEDRMHKAAESLLANADWNVGGVLSAESSIRDFPSNGVAKVRLRDLARIRDSLKTVPHTPAWNDAPETIALKAERDRYRQALEAMTKKEPCDCGCPSGKSVVILKPTHYYAIASEALKGGAA